LQRDEDEPGDEASAPTHDGSAGGDEIEPEDEQELEDSFQDTRQEYVSQADGKEVDQEVDERADEQGDEISHEHSEYAEPEAEFGSPVSFTCPFHLSNINV
jgi:hypothetical protein